MSLTEEQIKQGLKDKIKQLETQIEACKIALRAFGDNSTSVQEGLFTSEPKFPREVIVANKNRKTVRSRVEGLLADAQRPMTSREIMDSINQTYNKKYTFNNFSGNFSQTYRKAGSKIEKYEIADVPIELKTVYGLKSWFEGEEMKREYVQRFMDNHT